MLHEETPLSAVTGDVPETRPGVWHELRRNWMVLSTATLGSALGVAGLTTYTLPLFVRPLKAEFGWSTTQITTSASFLTIGILLSAALAGRLCDRFGVRRVIPASIFLFATALALMTQVRSSVWTLYIGYLLLAVSGAATAYTCYSRAVTANFDRGRGVALGIMMSGSGLSAALAPVILPRLIAAWGWRGAWLWMSLVVLLLIPLAIVFLRDDKQEPARRRAPAAGLELRQALRTRQFWLLAAGILLLGTAVVGTQLYLLPMLLKLGASQEHAESMLSLYGFTVVGSRLVVGLLLDRMPARFLAAVVFTLPAVGFVLTATFGVSMAPVLAVCTGLAGGSEGDVMGYLAGRYFGMRSYAEIFGWLFTALALGLVFGPIAIGRLGDATSVTTPLWLGAAMVVISAVCYASLGRQPSFAERGHEAPSGHRP